MQAGNYLGHDTGFHFRNGQIWAATWPHLSATDTYSWTAVGRTITHATWLYDLLLYSLTSTFGRYGEVIAFAGLVTLWVASCIFVFLRLGLNVHQALGCTVLILIGSVNTLYLTPQLTGNIFFVWALFLAERERRRECQGFWWKWAILLVLWANVHPDFPVTLVMLAGLFWERRFSRELWAALAGEVLGIALLTPDHFGTWLYPFQFLFEPTNNYIAEWKPIVASTFATVLYLAVAIIVSIRLWQQGKRRAVMGWLLWLPFLWLAHQHIRQLPFLLMLATFLWFSYDKDKETVEKREIEAWIPAMAITFFGLLVFLSAPPTDALYEKAGRPVKALQYLQAHHLDRYRWFNVYDTGGYLIGADPALKVFIDGRQDVYTGKMEKTPAYNWMQADIDLEIRGQKGVNDLKAWGVQYALVHAHTPLAQELALAGEKEYADRSFEIYKLAD